MVPEAPGAPLAMNIEPWQLLGSLGILLALAEFFTPTFFALPAGLAFLATAACAFTTQNWTVLALLLAINLAIVYSTFQRFVWSRLVPQSTKTNADAMVGQLATVSETIDPKTGAGEVKLYGDTWRVIAEQRYDEGQQVRILRTEGNRVVIGPDER